MKKTLSLFLLFLLGFPLLANANIMLNDIEYSLDTLETFQAGPGTTYISIQMRRISDRGGRLDAFIMQVDRRNPYISFQQVLGRDAVIGTEQPSAMAERKSTPTRTLFAGTNGDFFSTSGDIGIPTGLTIGDNEYAHIGAQWRVGAISEDNRPVLGTDWQHTANLVVGDKTLKIHHINYKRAENELVLYNRHNAATTLTNEYGTELLCELVEGQEWHTTGDVQLRVIGKYQQKGSTPIAPKQAVLSGHGTMAAELDQINEGDLLTVNFTLTIDGESQNIAQCVGGDNYALIVNNGQVEQSNFWNENHPRTGFGHSVTGDTVIFCVVDGRGFSVGCTTKVLGEIMQHYGAWKATNWDGGGSSCMYIRQLGPVNTNSDGKERAVGNAMFAVANLPAEDNTVAVIRSYTPTLRLPKYGVFLPKFLSYNQYDLLLNPDVEGVTLSCDEATGYIDDKGRFVCLGNGTLTATYGNITCTIPVRLEENAIAHIRLDTIIVSDDTRYPIEVESVVGKNTITIQPSALRWDVTDESVCSVSSEGVLAGLSNGGTWVYGTLGENKPDSLYVIVEIPATKPLLWNDMRNADAWKVEPSEEDWNTALRTNADGKAELYMHYTGGRQPNIMLTLNDSLYSVPERVEFRCGKSDFPVKELSLTLQANKSREPKTHNVVLSPDWTSVSVRIDSLLGAEGDMSVYPVLFQDIILYLQTSSEYMNKDYVLPIEGIYLHYPKLSVGIENVHDGSLFVYPNPTADMLHISGISGCATAVLYDLQGRQVLAGELTEADSSLDISRLTEGTYLLQLQGQTVKIIKK